MSTAPGSCANCGRPLGEDGRCRHCGEGWHRWTLRDWRPLLQLALMVVLGFSFVRLVTGAWSAHRQELAASYYEAGARAMSEGHPAAAVNALENAVIYSHNNFEYQLKLTDALLASGETGAAVAQLHSFLEQRPGDAQVYLKLARLEARRHHVDAAVLDYLAAINGNWPEHNDAFERRIEVRFESAEYLVQQGRQHEAEGALEALASVLPASWPEQGKLGDLFLRNGDAARALNVYETVLTQDPENSAVLMGAARASMATANYGSARRFLLALKPPTEESQTLLAQLNRMEELDPFAQKTTGQDRLRRTIAMFHIATRRMQRCGAEGADATGLDGGKQAKWGELNRWAAQLAPLMEVRKLRGRDDVIESTMRFAFQVEITAEKECGEASGDDEALLLLARERMGAMP